MSQKTQTAILWIRILSDLALVSLAWIIAYYVRFSGLFPYSHLPASGQYFKLIPFICGIWLLVFSASGFYFRTGRHRSAFLEALDILQSCILATLAFIAFTYVYDEYRYSRGTMLTFALLHPPLVITGRSLIRKTLRYYKRTSPSRKILIIGSGESLRHALEMSQMGDINRSEVRGVVLVGDADQLTQARNLCEAQGISIIQKPNNWSSFFVENPTETVVIALPHRHYQFLDEELEAIVDQVPDIKLIPDLMRYTRFAAGVEVVNGTPVINIHESPLAGIGSIIKRLIDIGGALFGIVLFSPIMGALALLVPLTSRGPIFYRQERMGLDGKTFHILKFRSMPTTAEKKTGAVWATKEDNRATPIGKFIRKTSLDELPQLFNVVKGDMSLVGPRPERPVFVDQFRQNVPGYYLRHKVKAGCTGWAQVNGWRGNTSIEKRIECDLYYIQNWSVWFDLRIIFLTIFRGFINKNAY